MGANGEERVIRSFFALPRMACRAMISALTHAIKMQREEEIYKNYIADAVKCISENTAIHEESRVMARRYYDIIHPERVEETETRTGEEIVEDVLCRIGAKRSEEVREYESV